MRYLHPPLRLSVVGEFFAKSRSSVMVCWVLAGLFCVFSFSTSSHGKTLEYPDFVGASLYHDEEALAYELDVLVAELKEHGWDFEGEAELESFSLEEKVVVLHHVLAAFETENLADGSDRFVYKPLDQGYEVAAPREPMMRSFEEGGGGGAAPVDRVDTGATVGAAAAGLVFGVTKDAVSAGVVGLGVVGYYVGRDYYHRDKVRDHVREAIAIKRNGAITESTRAELLEDQIYEALKHNDSISDGRKFNPNAIRRLDIDQLED